MVELRYEVRKKLIRHPAYASRIGFSVTGNYNGAILVGKDIHRRHHLRLLHRPARTHPFHRRTQKERDRHPQGAGRQRKWHYHIVIL